MEKQSGQVVIILLLIIVVALAIGLSIVGRSTTEISTSSKTEQSSRAFSAAEAGIERALQESNSNPTNAFSSGFVVPTGFFGNQSSATVGYQNNLPALSDGLEYPPFGKESFGQFWLVDPTNTGTVYYTSANSSFDIYFGNANTSLYANNPQDKPAIEVNVVVNNNGTYDSRRYFYDSISRATANNFQLATCTGVSSITTNYSPSGTTNNRPFLCLAHIIYSKVGDNANAFPVLVRVRILYSSLSHPVAIYPDAGSRIPPQARMYTSTGSIGNIQRKIQVFQESSVLPQFLDYVLFSSNQINKAQ